MELDVKQKVLLAIYTEYQKDIPIIQNITHNMLGIGLDEFRIAIIKLENEGLIRDTIIPKGKVNFEGNKWGTFSPILDNTKMTSYGIEYVENKLGIDKTLSGLEKVEYLAKKSVNLGWNEFKDIIIQVLSEMGKHGIDKIMGEK